MNPAAGNGRLLVLTGIDGAGKSTTLKLLAEGFPDWEVGSYNPDSWITAEALPQLAWMLDQDPRPVVGRLEPSARASFLGHMIVAHWECWLQPRLVMGQTVLMDSYFLRFLAREKVRQEMEALSGHGPVQLLTGMVSQLPLADCTVILDIDPETAVRRKVGFDPNELGGTAAEGQETAAFVQFQGQVREALVRFGRDYSRHLVVLSGEQSAQETAEAAAAAFVEALEADND